jgi:TetR/AcrR family transcriptional regulator, tetracycline repressor protein
MGRYAVKAACRLPSAIISLTAEPGPSRVLDDTARDAAIRVRRATLSALDPERVPHVVASAAALAEYCDQEDYYDQGIELLVQGVRPIAPA